MRPLNVRAIPVSIRSGLTAGAQRVGWGGGAAAADRVGAGHDDVGVRGERAYAFRMNRYGVSVWVWHLELQRRGGGGGGTLGGGWAFRIVHSGAFGDRHVVGRSTLRRLPALTPKLLVRRAGHVPVQNVSTSTSLRRAPGSSPAVITERGQPTSPTAIAFTVPAGACTVASGDMQRGWVVGRGARSRPYWHWHCWALSLLLWLACLLEMLKVRWR